MSRSPMSFPLFSLSQGYIDASLKKIHPLVQKILYIKVYDFYKEVQVTKTLSALKLVTMIYCCKFEENPFTGLKYILFTKL